MEVRTISIGRLLTNILVMDNQYKGFSYLVWSLMFGAALLIICGVLFLTKRIGVMSWIYAILCLPVSIVWLSYAAGVIVDVITVSHPLKFISH